MAKRTQNTEHRWQFHRLGGFDQVIVKTADDLRNLPALDQKLWAALSCPTVGVEFDAHTLALLDADGDGRIRVPEVLAATSWVCRVLKHPADIFKSADALPLDAIDDSGDEGRQLLASAKRVLENLGKGDAVEITAEDSADTAKIFAETRFNGDGVVPASSAEDDAVAAAIEDIMASIGSETDRSGAEGISETLLEDFCAEAKAYLEWWGEAEADSETIRPLGDATDAAAAVFGTVKSKIDDYFTRAALLAYDQEAAGFLNPGEADYRPLRLTTLSASDEALAELPVARVDANAPLSLTGKVNPAWAAALDAFRGQVAEPLLGATETLSREQWDDITGRFAAHAAWVERHQGDRVAGLGVERIRALTDATLQATIRELITEDRQLAEEAEAIGAVDRLVHYYRHLDTLLHNFVSLRDFYTPGMSAIFQAGTLYLDGRNCDLCVFVTDMAAHSKLATLSQTYLAYCECRRRGGEDRMIIAAAFTGGDADNLMVGRNGVFYDRNGDDWDATIVKLIEHPISISQAFWSPYKRLGKMISQQIEKFAGAQDKAVEAGTAKGVGDLSATAQSGKSAPTPFDIGKFAGIFAAIGLAVGAIGTALASVLTGFLGLTPWQMPLAVAGLLLLISGPAMLMAYMKLRRRNLGPMLDANGWAVNTLARINMPFGASLTGTAELPRGAQRSMRDPYAEKKRPWKTYLFLLVLFAVVGGLWQRGYLDQWWSQFQQRGGAADTRAAPADADPGTEPEPAAEDTGS